MKLSPRRAVALISTLFTLYSAARVGVLFFESVSVVRAERAEDAELLELCQTGQARGSAKMREACLKARADMASPVLFKAVLKAVSTAFKDFTDSFGSPFKLLVLMLFVLSSVLLPVSSWLRVLFGAVSNDAEEDNGQMQYIAYSQPASMRAHWKRVMQKLRRRSHVGCADVSEDVEPGTMLPAMHFTQAVQRRSSVGDWTTILLNDDARIKED